MKRKLLLLVLAVVLLLTACGKTPTDYTTYVGEWISPEASMQVSSNNAETMNISVYLPNDDGSRIAEFELSLLISNIENDSITTAFEDSWGVSGTAVITFKEDTIEIETKNTSPIEEMWGTYEGVFSFTRDDADFSQEQEYDESEEFIEPEEPYYEEEYVEPESYYDTSKASGILAQAGLTEDQFRSQCTVLHFKTPYDYFVEMGKQYLQQHPEEDKTEEYRKVWQNGGPDGVDRTMIYGNEQGYVDSYYHDLVYDQLVVQSGDLVAKMFEYPADYIGKHFVIPSMYAYCKGSSSDGSIYYENNDMSIKSSNGYERPGIEIWDYRDDPNYPTIREKDTFDAYVIFMGVDADDNMEFALISVDKVDN